MHKIEGKKKYGGIIMTKQIVKIMAVASLIGVFMTGCGGNTNQAGVPTTKSTAETAVTDNTTQTSTTANASGEISEEEAKKIAMEHAGVSEGDVKAIWAHKDRDDGQAIYEIEFYTDSKKYEYDIKADDGKVLKLESENNNKYSEQSADDIISEEEAKKTTLGKVAGATENDIRIKLDSDDGRMQYEGDIIYDGTEYEFEIDASTGEILKWEEDSTLD